MTSPPLTAAQQDALLRRPFDHYARYRLASEVVTATAGADARVLDLGGGPGSLQAFLPDARVTATDIVHPGVWHEQAPSLVLADGAALPFADDAFDVVVSLDTLEHVVPGSRTPFLAEVARVAGRWALVVCPFDTPGVADADTALRAYVANRFAPDLPTIRILDEHLGYGHPDLDASRELLGPAGPVGVIPSGRLDRWFAGMITFFHLLALGDDEPVEVVQRFLNRSWYEADLAEPAYRHGLLVRTAPADVDDRDPSDIIDPLLERAARAATAGTDLDLLRVVLTESLVERTTAAVAELRTATERLAQTEEAERRTRQHNAGLEAARGDDARTMEGLTAQVAALEAELDELRAFRQAVHDHPAARARRAVRRLADTLGGRG